MEQEKKLRVLLGCTGSVASIKVLPLVEIFQNMKVEGHSVDVKVVATTNALHFMPIEKLEKLCEVYTDTNDDEKSWKRIQQCYISLKQWADLFLIAPIDANTLAKIANGLSDNLVTCIARSWDFKKPLLFCPAMNTHMWEHPVTSIHISKLKEFGFIEMPTVSKRLACNDVGFGGMAELPTITSKIMQILSDRSICKY